MSSEEYDGYKIPANAEVRLSAWDNYTFAPTYYIITRTKKGRKVSFKCYDKMIFTDQTITIGDSYFSDGYIKSVSLGAYIAKQCGFTALWFNLSSELVYDFDFPKEDVIGKNCRTLLEEISAAWCGIFKVTNKDELMFLPFGSIYKHAMEATAHTKIIEGGTKGPIEQVVVTGGETTYFSGSVSADVFNTLKINTRYASQSLANFLAERLDGYIYEAWSCDKCITDSDIEVNAQITFGDGSVRIANNIVKYPAARGIFVSCGQSEVIESEFDYVGALSRKIEKKIEDGEKLGNQTMITRYQGIIHLGEKTTDDDGNELQNRYGYSSATANGIVEFDGAITSKVVPQSARINADKTEATISYQDKTYKYNISYANDGSIAGINKSEVTAE